MTLIISMCTKNGIYTISDSKLTNEYENAGSTTKTIILNEHVALSFWGTYKFNENDTITTLIEEFKKKINQTDKIERVSEELQKFWQNKELLDYEDQIGFHLIGYDSEDKPCLKHVFHDIWLQKNQFINEDSRFEYHQGFANEKEGVHQLGYRKIAINKQFPILFNGENSLPNLIINGVGIYQDSINYWEFSEKEAREFLANILDWAIKLSKFRNYFKEKKNGIVDYPLTFCKIMSGKKSELQEIKSA